MKADVAGLEAEPAVSSSEVSMSDGAAGEFASLPITDSASSVGPCGRSTSSGPERIWPPADSIMSLTQTVKPS